MDIRGHGDSDTTVTSYDDVAMVSDTLALVDELADRAPKWSSLRVSRRRAGQGAHRLVKPFEPLRAR
jgi:pimeloyl-ACP methyl ester carboxylesterase